MASFCVVRARWWRRPVLQQLDLSTPCSAHYNTSPCAIQTKQLNNLVGGLGRAAVITAREVVSRTLLVTRVDQIKAAIDDCRKYTNFANYTNCSSLITANLAGSRTLPPPPQRPELACDASVFIKSAISGVHSPSRRRAAPLKVKHYENVIRQNFPEDWVRAPPSALPAVARARPGRGGERTPAVASVRPRSSRARRRLPTPRVPYAANFRANLFSVECSSRSRWRGGAAILSRQAARVSLIGRSATLLW